MEREVEFVITHPTKFEELIQNSPLSVTKLTLVNLPNDLSEIAVFKNLENLILYQCYNLQLKNFLEKLGGLKKIKKLSFIECNIDRIPSEICTVVSLEELEVVKNLLYELPIEIKKLNNLSVLNLRQNQFHEIPEIVFQIESLRILNLEENHIYKISSKILKLQKLNELHIALNPLRNLFELENYFKGLKKITLDKKQLSFQNDMIFQNLILVNNSSPLFDHPIKQ